MRLCSIPHTIRHRSRLTLKQAQRARLQYEKGAKKLRILAALDWMIEGEHDFSFSALGSRCGIATTTTRATVLADDDLRRIVVAYRRFKSKKRLWRSETNQSRQN